MLSPHDEQVAARDPALPGLRILLDPPALLQILQQRLGHVELKQIRGAYLRYKPQTNCLASYELDTSLGKIDIYAKAYISSDAQKLRKVRRASASPLGPGALHLGEVATGVWIFPNDETLTSLRILRNESACRRMLEKLIPTVSDFSEYSIHRLSYKPQRRFVGQLRIADRPVAVLRFYTESDFLRTNRNAKVIEPTKSLRIARRLGRSKRFAVTAVQWLEGDLLSDVLARENCDVSLYAIGHALADLHANHPGKLELRTRQMEVDALKETADFAAAICPQLRDELYELATQLGNYLLRLPARTQTVHGDFYAQQILLQADGVAFLDLDEAYKGDSAADIGNFLAHFWRQAPQRLKEFQETFLDGYCSASGAIDRDHINRYTAASLLRLISEPFRRRETDWPARMEAILRQAQTLLKNVPCIGAPASPKPKHSASVHDPFSVGNDPLMPFLADATNPEHIPKLFAAHLLRPAQLLALRVVRYKPQRRCLIEYDLETSGSNATLFTLIGKARAKGLDKRTYALQRQLFHAGFDDDAEDEISVPEPISLIPRWQMWLQRRVPGVPSIDLLSAHLAPQLPARLAETIFKLHQCAVHPKRSHSMQDELRLLRQKLPPVAQRHPHLEKRLGRLLEQCCCVGESIGAAPVCPVHRDFYHDQVVVDGSHLYLLDLDLFALGDAALDVGNFIGHLIEYGLRNPSSATALAEQQEQMTEHYVQLAGEPLRRRILIYSALTLARQIYISTLFDSRAPFTESILALCEGRLAEIL